MSTAELLAKQEYKYGFVTDIESDVIPRGLSEDTIRLIVEKKNAEALAQHSLPDDRLPGHHLLQRAEAEGDEEESRRSRSGTAAHV